MKKQMFNCLLYRGQQGIITKVSSYLKKYLQQNEKIAQLFFYTIIAIAEDQMACYKYNVNKLCGIGEKIDYQPNRKKPPVWVKRIFEKNGIDLYNSKREEIIQKYLIREKKKDLSTWNIENGDLQTLCYVSNCGLSFDNHEFSMIMRKIFPYLLSIISNVEDYDEFIDVYAVDEVITFISKQDNISDTTKYEDHFVAENRLIAISKSGRSMDSEDAQNFLNATERGIDVQLFVRKNKDDKISKEFYYLGRVIATGNAKQFVMPNTDKTAVEERK